MDKLNWNFQPSHDYHGDWHGYFEEYRNKIEELNEYTAMNPVRNEIVVPRHSIDVSELPKPIRDVVDMVPGKWKAMHSQTFHEGAVYKSGAHTGEKRPDKTVDHYAIGLVSNNPLTAVWSDGKMQYAKGVLNGELFWTDSIMELKRKIREGWNG